MIASSPDIDGGFDQPTPVGQSVTFKRDSTGSALVNGQVYTLIIGTVTNPTTPGNYSLTVSTSGGTSDPSSNFSIVAGPVARIAIEDAAGGTGTEIGALSQTTDDDGILQFFAVGYDEFGNFVQDQSVTWAVTGGIGSVSPTSGTSTTMTSITTPGTGRVTADDGSNHVDQTGDITVTVGALDNVKVVEGASGDGPEFTTKTMTTDESVTVHAAGYDADGNYRGSDETVTWSLTNGNGTLSTNSGTSTVFQATTVGTEFINADHADINVTDDGTGAITINPGNLDHFDVTTTPAGAKTAGTAFTITVTAKDADGNDVSHTGTVTLSDNTGTLSSVTGLDLTFTNSTSQSINDAIITLAQSGVFITATEGAITGTSNTFTVNPGAVDHFSIAPIGDPQTAGVPFPITVTAQDANNNTVTSFGGTVNIIENAGNLTPDVSDAFNAGVLTQSVTFSDVGTGRTITVDDGSGNSGTSNAFDVVSGTLDHFDIATIGDPQTAGTPFDITVTAKDVNGNDVIPPSPVTVSLTDNTGTLTASDVTLNGSATGTSTGAQITKAQSGVFITASGSGKLGQSNTFTVNPAALDHFTVTNTSDGNIGTQGAGVAFNIKLVALDVFDNVVTSHTGAGSEVSIAINTGTITPTTSGTFTSGVLASQSVTVPESGNDRQITVTGGSPVSSGSSNLFNVTSQSVQSFEIDPIGTPQTAGEPFLVTVKAKDGPNGTGNVATDFTGTVDLSLNVGTVVPATSGNFTGGIWTGQIEVQSLGGSSTGKVLQVANTSNPAQTGASNAFEVKPGPPSGSVAFTATPNTLPADGSSTSQISSDSAILDEFGNLVGQGRQFTVSLNPVTGGSITTPDVDPGRSGVQVATDASSFLAFEFQAGTEGGTVEVSAQSDSGNATGSVSISLGSLNIVSVTSPSDFVSRGQSGTSVQMVVRNLSQSTITISDANLTFTDAGSNDVTAEYTVTRTDGVTQIAAGGQVTLTFDVTVGTAATLGTVTVDGLVNGLIGGSTPVSAPPAASPHQWEVQLPFQISGIRVSSPTDTVAQNQQATVTVTISNPAPASAATAIIDNIQLRFFKDGVGPDLSANFPSSPSGSNPTTIPAAQQRDFDFTVTVGASAEPGDYEIDAEVTAHDFNSTSLSLTDTQVQTRQAWFVKSAPALQILSITPSPRNSFLAGTTEVWTARMAVANNGSDAINIDFNVGTFIRFALGAQDKTSEFTIVNPTQLLLAGTGTLNASATDTLVFTITQTGSTVGTYEIRGSVEGNDAVTGGRVDDNTDDGGTGQIEILSGNETVKILSTEPAPSTPNVSQTIGIVNTNQPFQVQVQVRNDLSEPVLGVQVRLTRDGTSTILAPDTTLALIPANSTVTFDYNVVASVIANPGGETFTADIIDAGVGQLTQQPASEGGAIDDKAIFRIQTPAALQVQLQVDANQTVSDTFLVQATVTNAGQSQVASDGLLRLTLPPNYTLVSGALDSNFAVGIARNWQIQAPAAVSGPDAFIAIITSQPTEFNTGVAAQPFVPADTQLVNTLDVDLSINSFAIVSPQGATDDTLSTGQLFTVEASLTASQNIDQVQADLFLPPGGYDFSGVSQSRQILTGTNITATWDLTAATQAHTLPRQIQLHLQAFDSGVQKVDSTVTIDVLTVDRAFISFDDFSISNSSGAQIERVSKNQRFQLSALVREQPGGAGVVGPTQVTLNLDTPATGLLADEPLQRTFVPNVPVVWNVTAPDSTTAVNTVSVTLDSIPDDENTSDVAASSPTRILELKIQTVDLGVINIDSVFVQTSGAENGVVSTEQNFVVVTKISWSGVADSPRPSATMILPPGANFQAPDLDQDLTSAAGTQNLQWQITAPNIPTALRYIKFTATARDASNPDVIRNAVPDSLGFTVVRKTELRLDANIVGVDDGRLTVGQLFTVRANLTNNGTAMAVGQDSVRLTIPTSAGYATSEPLTKAISAPGEATWQVRAPNLPHNNILPIKIEVITRNIVDENSGLKPPYTPDPPERIISVTTEEVGLNVALLTDKQPATIVRGAKNQPIIGLELANNSDNVIEVQQINVHVYDRDNTALAPNAVFSKMSAVDFDDPTTVFDELAPPGSSNPVVFAFNPTISIAAREKRNVLFQVDILSQTEVTNFKLTIDSPAQDILARDISSDTVATILNSEGVPFTGPINPDISVLIDGGLESSFFNFPNPFGQPTRPLTSFNYVLTQDSDITLSIYTLLGELVWTASFSASNPVARAGTHDGKQAPTIQWDGRNNKNQKVLNGVYIAILKTNSGKAMTKIAIAK